MNKKQLRDYYLQKRQELLPTVIDNLSRQIVKQFAKLPLDDIKLVHIFYPIAGKKEFNSLLLKEWLANNYPDIRFVLPKSNASNHTLTNILWEDNTPLAINQWGITEPEHGVEVAPQNIDLVIIPLLAFDKLGNRVGYGKGFYDRFLSDCRPNVLKAGVSYFEPEDEILEVNIYDAPLNICVTPEKVWHFSRPD
ncbi:MAG: 5-formyltetrahydrofolate cyclo-ligase [Sphingobacteriaceae bacterium]|nr:5-formyltetrahydrofolate cyclo-ligase [Sphingobacteriaceae bacterium]